MKLALTISSLVWYLLLLAGGAALCLAFSGTIRAFSGYPIDLSLGLSVAALTAAIIFSIRQKLFKLCMTPASVYAAILLLSSFWLFGARLYDPIYNGLVSVGGGDAGIHAHFQQIFISSEPDTYQAFVSFFAVTYWLQKLFSMNTFESFRFDFYASLLLIFALFATLAWLVGREASFRRKHTVPIFFALFALLAYFPFERIVVPILHYLQAEGFYPQLAGLLPVLCLWCAFAGIEDFVRRLIAVCFGIIVTRYTYGLNLPDVMLTSAALLFLDSRPGETKRKMISNPLAAILWVLALLGYQQLFTVFDMKGAIVKTNLGAVICGQIVLSMALIAAASGLSLPLRSAGLRRLYQFAGYFGLIGAAVGSLFLFGATPPSYYPFKHAFYSSIICSVAACLSAAQLAAQRIEDWGGSDPSSRPNRRSHTDLRLAGFLICFLLGLWQLKIGYAPYQPAYRERIEHRENAKLLTPLADLEAWTVIEKTLHEKHAQFDGFITPSWPISSFMNASFGFFGELPFYRSGRVPPIEHSCIFWSSDPLSRSELEKPELERALREIDELSARENKTTVNYLRSSDHTARAISMSCSG